LSNDELADIAKAYYITENEESEFMALLEREGNKLRFNVSCVEIEGGKGSQH